MAATQGSIVTDRYDDILGKALPNPEHSGRTRGIGSYSGWKTVYTGQKGKRQRRTSYDTDARMEQRVHEVESRFREQLESAEADLRAYREKQERLERQVAMLMSQQMGAGCMPMEEFQCSPARNVSSCQSVEPPNPLDSITVI